MKITAESQEMINWEAVHTQVTAEAQEMATAAVNEAQRVLSQLKAGERKTVTVKVGSITVARPK